MLTSRERYLLQQVVNTWLDCDSPLTGDVSYQELFDLFDKLGVKYHGLRSHLGQLGRSAKDYHARKCQ